MKKSIITSTIMLAAAALIAVFSSPAAAIQGACGDCHTMHNSQGGSEMATGGPYAHLLAGDCVACHTGTNTEGKAYVLSTGEPTFGTDTLAGGNFYWVADAGGDDDTKGHNVYGISVQDLSITAAEGAPGDANGTGGCTCHETLATAAGGCEGCHLDAAHHSDNSGTVTVAPWFRWLAKCNSGVADATHGVAGIEDNDWDFETATDHNEYLGVVGGHDATQSITNHNMSAFCSGCHGNFHIQNTVADGSGSWTRHPSDAVIPASGEYSSAFGGGGADSWDPTVPVARPAAVINAGTVTNIVTPGTDMVMCLSCHVAHGSPYSDMLRWDYTLMILDTTGAGQGKSCFVCHTQKDG
ncbi:MAG: hypothetical protein HWN69_03655 [Desulfobacterales bacterium]|nr:hypothetical protein [Desulfobacterales bacterium]